MSTDKSDLSHILSAEIRIDRKLEFSAGIKVKEKIKEIITHSVPTVKTLEEKVDCLKKVFQKQMSFPNNYELATIANGFYDDYEKLHKDEDGKYKHGEDVYPNWKLLTVAYDSGTGSEEITAGIAARLASNAIAKEFMDIPNGYCGAAYWNPLTQQVVIAHSGTKNKGGVYADIYGVFLNEHVPQIDSAVTFTDVITSVLKEINDERGSNIQLFITGHSLGAWLSSITVFSAKHLKRKDDCFVENPDFEKSGYYSTAVVFDGPGCEEMLRRIEKRLFNRYAGSSFITSLDITNYLSAPNLINACNLHVGDVYRIIIPLSEEDEKHLSSLRKKNFLQKFVKCVKRHSTEVHVVIYTRIMHKMLSLKSVFDKETGDVLSDNGNLRIQKVIDWPLLTSSDKKEEVRSKILHGGMRSLEVLGTLTAEVFGIMSDISLIGRVIRLVFQGVEVIYESYKSAKWYKNLMQELDEFLQIANETNSFQPHESAKYFKGTGREIRYETRLLASTYKNEHSLNVFTSQERRFVEEFKYLEKYETDLEGIVRLDEMFDFLEGDKMLLNNIRKILKCYEVDSSRIKSEDLQICVICVKCVLNLFPEIWQKVDKAYQNLPLVVHKKIYQRISSSYVKSFKMILDFNDNTLGLQDFLCDDNKTVLHVAKCSTSLGAVMAYNTFKNVKKNSHSYEEEDNHLFFSLQRIFCSGTDVFISFIKKIDSKYLLFLECDCKLDLGVQGLLLSLFETVKENNNDQNDHMKVVLITERGMDLSNFVSEYLRSNSFAYQEENDEIVFDDLTTESQNRLLENTVLFQGVSVSLSKVVNGCNTLNTVIDEETIVELFQNDLPIEIGKGLPSLDVSENYNYIERQVIQNIKVEKEILVDENLSDIFAVCNCSKEQLSELTMGKKVREFIEMDPDVCNPIRFIVFDENCDESHFNFLYEEYSNCNIHWLEMTEDGLIYKKSHSIELCGVRKYIQNYGKELLENEYSTDNPSIKLVKFNDIKNFEEKVIIIAAQPGMGKTTAFTYLAEKKRDDSQWLIRTNLREHRINLEEVKFDEITDVVDFFCGKNSFNELTRKLFLSRLNETGNIVFLLDGFDEITSEGQKHILNLLKLLQDTKTEKVFISTRLHLRNTLENSLSTLAYSFKPFFADDQDTFLKRFWGNAFDPEILEDSFKNYIERFLKYLFMVVRDNERNLMRTPLVIRMVAEVLQIYIQEKAFFDFSKNTSTDFPQIFDRFLAEYFDRLKLYQEFVRLKYRVYLTKKCAQDIDPNDEIVEAYFLRYGRIHRVAALKCLFPQYEKIFFKEKSLTEREEQMLNMIGIAQIINDEIVFIHRSFAEYFLAELLARRLKRTETDEKYKVAYNFLSQEIIENCAEFVKNMNDVLSPCPHGSQHFIKLLISNEFLFDILTVLMGQREQFSCLSHNPIFCRLVPMNDGLRSSLAVNIHEKV